MDDRVIGYAERLAVLEHRVEEGNADIKELKVAVQELLQLRSKGTGAFWLASSLLGTGIVGAFVALVDWVKG